MAYQYDLRPGELIESDGPLSVEEIEAARAALESGDTLAKVAKRLGARIFDPPPERVRRVGVDVDALLRHVADDEALDEILGFPQARQRLEESR